MSLGQLEYTAALEKWVTAKEADSYPGIADNELLTLERPAWAVPDYIKEDF